MTRNHNQEIITDIIKQLTIDWNRHVPSLKTFEKKYDSIELNNKQPNYSDLSKSRLGNKCPEIDGVRSVGFQMTADVFHLLPPVTFRATEFDNNIRAYNNAIHTVLIHKQLIQCRGTKVHNVLL